MRKKLALVMSALFISLTILTSYKTTAEASVLPGNPGLAYSTFSTLFGNFWGFMESTDSMTTNHVKDNVTAFVDDLTTPDSVTWGDIAIDPGTSARNAFCNLLVTAKMAYDASIDTYGYNPLLYALDKKSYSATGTLFSEGASVSVDEAIAKYEAMSDSEFDGILSDLNLALNDDTFAGSLTDVRKIRSLFDDLMIGTIGISNYEANEWLNPVSSTIYEFNDLGIAMVQVNGVDFKINRITEFVGKRYDVNETYKYVTDRPVICISIACDGNRVYAEMIDTERFYFTQYKKTTGSYNMVNSAWTSSGTSNGKFYLMSIMGSTDSSVTFISNMQQVVSWADRKDWMRSIEDYLANNNILSKETAYLDDAESIKDTAPEYAEALDTLDNKQITLNDLMDLATNIAAIQSTAGTDSAVDDLTDTINGIAVTLPDAIVDGKNDVVQAVEGVGEAILTLPKAIWLEFEGVLEAIRTKAEARPWEDGVNNQNSNDILLIFNGLLLLLYIIIILLRIFVHCLQLIISIFAVPPSSALLPEEMVMGLEHLNSIQIPVIGLSVYSFMMGLVYILIVFYAIRILRINIDRIKVPKHTSGGL